MERRKFTREFKVEAVELIRERRRVQADAGQSPLAIPPRNTRRPLALYRPRPAVSLSVIRATGAACG